MAGLPKCGYMDESIFDLGDEFIVILIQLEGFYARH
jgi:hypothetical protein